MSVDEKENAVVDTIALRAELKQWESQFKAANGKKAGREDIKKDASISAKYKLYDRLTRPPKQQVKANGTPRKSKHTEAAHRSPSKRSTNATPRKTPNKAKAASASTTLVLSPVQEVEPTPAFIRNALGPTPQKDGQVLGLFDMLAEETPLKGNDTAANAVDIVGGTPSKPASASSNQAHFKSPEDQGKRLFLDAFAGTPLKRKRDDNDIGTTSSSKRKFATPSFLRRSFPMASIREDSTEAASRNPPFRKRGLVRSLSSIIQGLKKQEEARMDDEWDVLNEIEEEEEEEEEEQAEQHAGMMKKKKKKNPGEKAQVQVEDSHAVEMPLGPDQGVVSDEDSASDGAQTAGRKPWKKKGLKRQTRRVIMRPVLHKAGKADERTHEGSDDEVDVVAETQVQDGPNPDSEDELAATSKSKKASKSASKAKGKEMEDSTKKGAKKVDPNKHANFRKLNIKNRNSKANGRGKKFGRR